MIQRIQLQLSSPQPLKKQPIDKPPFAHDITVQIMYGWEGIYPPANSRRGGGGPASASCPALRFDYCNTII